MWLVVVFTTAMTGYQVITRTSLVATPDHLFYLSSYWRNRDQSGLILNQVHPLVCVVVQHLVEISLIGGSRWPWIILESEKKSLVCRVDTETGDNHSMDGWERRGTEDSIEHILDQLEQRSSRTSVRNPQKAWLVLYQVWKSIALIDQGVRNTLFTFKGHVWQFIPMISLMMNWWTAARWDGLSGWLSYQVKKLIRLIKSSMVNSIWDMGLRHRPHWLKHTEHLKAPGSWAFRFYPWEWRENRDNEGITCMVSRDSLPRDLWSRMKTSAWP